MSTSAVRTGCPAGAVARSRRNGVSGTGEQRQQTGRRGHHRDPEGRTGRGGPHHDARHPRARCAWPMVGRTMPSKPLTAIRSCSGTSAGSQAVYAG